jgi:hypothetical protein
MKSIFETKTCVGIGDLIFTYSLTEQVKHIYSEIKICPDYSILKSVRSGSKESYLFTKQFVSLLFNESYYTVLDELNLPTINPEVLSKSLNRKIKFVDLTNKTNLFIPIDIGIEDYVVINTKIRGITRTNFDLVKDRFFEVIKNSKRKIVLIGERNNGINKEAEYCNIYTIYNDLITVLAGKDYIDFTKEVILDVPSIDEFKRDITIIKNAKGSISFGVSGIVTLNTAISKTCAVYRCDDFDYSYLDNSFIGMGTNKMVTTNIDKFIEFITKMYF